MVAVKLVAFSVKSAHPQTSMSVRTELKITYDQNMHPIGAICNGCREMMPTPPADLKDSGDIIMWFSRNVEHRKDRHASDIIGLHSS